MWDAFRAQGIAFWALSGYVFIEYVRPQQVWPAIDVIPLGKASLLISIVAYVADGLRLRRPQALDALLLAFTAILLASSVAAYQPAFAFAKWSLFLNWLLLYVLVSQVVTTPRKMLVFWALFLLWSLKMSQHGTRTFVTRGFSFASWGATGGPGWFQNSGEFAIQMCIFLPMALHVLLGLRDSLPRWKFWALIGLFPGTAFVSLVASSSRGGQLAIALVLAFVVAQSRHRIRGLLVSAAVLGALWLVVPEAQQQRFASMGEDQTSQSRLTYWGHGIEIMNEHPALGIGYNNWLPYYRRFYNPRGELPHNIFVEAGSELGYLGLMALIGLIVGTFYLNARTRRLARRAEGWGGLLRSMALGLDAALVGFMASGFFVTVLYYPFLWMNLALTAALHETARTEFRRCSRARNPPPRVNRYRASPTEPVLE